MAGGNASIMINKVQLELFPYSNDTVIIWSNTSSNVVQVPITNLFNGGNTPLNVNNLIISNNTTPSNSTQNTTPNSLWCDGNYIYYGFSNNVIKRVALSDF